MGRVPSAGSLGPSFRSSSGKRGSSRRSEGNRVSGLGHTGRAGAPLPRSQLPPDTPSLQLQSLRAFCISLSLHPLSPPGLYLPLAVVCTSVLHHLLLIFLNVSLTFVNRLSASLFSFTLFEYAICFLFNLDCNDL